MRAQYRRNKTRLTYADRFCDDGFAGVAIGEDRRRLDAVHLLAEERVLGFLLATLLSLRQSFVLT